MDPRDDPIVPDHFDSLSVDEQAKVLADLDNEYEQLSESLGSEDFKTNAADLLKEDGQEGASDLEASGEDEEEPMDDAPAHPSPVFPATGSAANKGSFRYALIQVTFYPGKEIHYGKFIPVDAAIFRTWSPDLSNCTSVSPRNHFWAACW